MGSPLFVQDASVKFTLVGPPAGTETEYNCDVHSAIVEVTAGDDVSYETLCPDGSYTRKGPAAYVLHLTGVQDWEGLSLFLWNNAAALADVLVQAHGATQVIDAAHPAIGGTVTLVEGSYGGEVDTWAEFDVSLPFDGRPDLLTAPPVAREAVEAAA